MPDVVLEAKDISRDFGGFLAVNGVNLQVRQGEIHALIGPNGAGKTTCFNLLTKFLQPSKGAIFFKGEEITRLRPAQIAKRGIVRSFQISAVFPKLSVLENVQIALQARRRSSFDFWRSESILREDTTMAHQYIEDVDLTPYRDTPAGLLSYGRKRALELATTLALDPEVMLLDEPTAGMGHEDIERVVEMIRRVRKGRAILMVEHNLPVVEGLCDHVTVLSRGRVLAEGDYGTVAANPDVIAAYLGSLHA